MTARRPAPRPVLKDGNPKDAVGVRKVPGRSLTPAPVVAEIGLALLEGARKYGAWNYRIAGVRASVYLDACGRHLDQFLEGEDVDPDSGLSHITKAMACLVVLRDSMLSGNWTDDRPPRMHAGWVRSLNEKASSIIDTVRPNDPVPPYTQTTHGTTVPAGTGRTGDGESNEQTPGNSGRSQRRTGTTKKRRAAGGARRSGSSRRG